jgi:hypothetical protein
LPEPRVFELGWPQRFDGAVIEVELDIQENTRSISGQASLSLTGQGGLKKQTAWLRLPAR